MLKISGIFLIFFFEKYERRYQLLNFSKNLISFLNNTLIPKNVLGSVNNFGRLDDMAVMPELRGPGGPNEKMMISTR